MGKKALKEWRHKLHELQRRKKEIAGLIESSWSLPDTQFHKQWTRKLEAKRASLLAEIDKHEKLGEDAGFSVGNPGGAKGARPKPKTESSATQSVSEEDLSKRSTENLEARVRAINRRIKKGAIRLTTPQVKVLRAEKESLTRELERRKASTGHQTQWKYWSKGPRRVRFWRGQ